MPPKVKKTYVPPKDLAALMDASVKKYGNSVVRHDEARKMEFVPTGVTALDMALGGGWARGRIHQVVGQPGSCKSSLTIIGLRNAQRTFPEHAVAYLDLERTWTDEWAVGLGLDRKRCLYAKPKSAEQAADIIRDWMRSEMVSLIALDSIGGMQRADALYEKSAEDSDMGKNGQVITRLVQQLATIGNDTNTGTILVNQYRANFKSMTGMPQAAGPMILGYGTTDSVTMRRLGGEGNVINVKRGGEDIEIAHKVVAKVERSKLTVQGRSADFWFAKETTEQGPVGIDEVRETVILAQMHNIVVPTSPGSSHWVLPDGSKENGGTKLVARLRADTAMHTRLKAMLVESIASYAIPETETTFTAV